MLRTLTSAWRLPHPQSIGRDQLAAVVRAMPAAALGSLVNAGVVAISLWNVVPHFELLAWFACTAGIAGCQLFQRPGNHPNTHAPLSARTLQRSVIRSAIAALPWSILVMLFLGKLPHSSELILIAIGAGMAASGSVFLAPLYPAALTYMAVILVPAALTCFFLASPGYVPLGFLSLSYAGFLFAVIATKAHLLVERSQSSALLHQREQLISAQNERLDTALENMSQGLAMYDATWRIVVANTRFATIYDLTSDDVVPGTTLREVLQHRMAKGHYPGKTLDQVLATTLGRVEGGVARQYVNELPEGRFIAVSSRPVAHGRLCGYAGGLYGAAAIRSQDCPHGHARCADRRRQ
jgi:PAS domain-containing protein